MPACAYRCGDCHADFEVFQSIAEPPVDVCPVGHAGAERLISGGAGFPFGGSGFHAADYRSKAYADRARGETGDTTAGGKVSS